MPPPFEYLTNLYVVQPFTLNWAAGNEKLLLISEIKSMSSESSESNLFHRELMLS